MSGLYRKFIQREVKPLLSKITNIRNCTIIAHVDHGKTTLTDSLVAHSGLLSKDLAAKARLLDFDKIEQERGITIKAAFISLTHEVENEKYLIHLVDTPGHVDFSSHVAKGVRISDGAVVVVDAIEGIMVQTETVLRQAVMDLVKPILFINKVDRLINEKRLTTLEVLNEINRIVLEFNTVLRKYLPDKIAQKWEVSLKKGTVAFGSALHGWGIGIEDLVGSNNSMKASEMAKKLISIVDEIEEAYTVNTVEDLKKKYPVGIPVLNMIVKRLPDPKTAQKYRIPQIWHGDINSDAGKAMINADAQGPLTILINNVQYDKNAGYIGTGRILSGTISKGSQVKVSSTGKIRKVTQVLVNMAKSKIPIDEVPAGNIVAIQGLGDIKVGDSVFAPELEMVPFEHLQFPSEPVVTYTVEPVVLKDLQEVQNKIMEYVKTDPMLRFEIREDTGEMLLSGLGELHIDVTLEMLKRIGVYLEKGKPMVIYREAITKDGEEISVGELDKGITAKVQALVYSEDKIKGKPIYKDEIEHVYLLDQSKKSSTLGDFENLLKSEFKILAKNGPYVGQKCMNLIVVIKDVKLDINTISENLDAASFVINQGIRKSYHSGEPTVYEPWIDITIVVPTKYVGTVTGIINKRHGKVQGVITEKTICKINAELPVKYSFGLATELRTETSGWATWGSKFLGFREMSKSEIEETFFNY